MPCEDVSRSRPCKPEIKLIATDMDGTLLNSRGQIDESFFGLFAELERRNIMFVVCSGRFYATLVRNFQRIESGLLLVAHNGAVVQHSDSEQPIFERNIEHKLVISTLQQLFAMNLEAEVYLAAKNTAYVMRPSADFKANLIRHDVDFVEIPSLFTVKEGIKKIGLFQKGGLTATTVRKVKEAFRETFECVAAGEVWLEMMGRNISKGWALAKIQERFGIGPENTLVFGDYYNDLELFQQAAYSFAMANAPADVKKAARFVAPDNDANGVVRVIKRYLAEDVEFSSSIGKRDFA